MDEQSYKHFHPQDFVKVKNEESGSEDVHYSIFYEHLPEEYRLHAEQELNETKDNREKGLKKLKAFMKKQNLSCSDDDLISVLRGCKYDIKSSERKLKNLLKFRQDISWDLAKLDNMKIESILDDMMFSVLPYRDNKGRAVFFTKATLRLDLYSVDNAVTLGLVFLLYIYSFPLSTVCGFSYIPECKTDQYSIFYPILKSYRHLVKYLVDLPVRTGFVDVVNELALVRLFCNAIRPFLPQKIAKKIRFHGSGYENLKKKYHPDILPVDLGGNLGPINDTFYRERFLSFVQELKAESQNSPVKRT